MKLFRFFFSIYALIVFVGLMLLVFLPALLSVFMGRIRGGNWVYRLCVLWSDVWFFFIFIRVKEVDTQLFDTGRKYIIVSNHISYLDVPVIVKVFRKPLRPLGKVEMSKVPVFGFIYQRAIVSVDRDSAGNRAKSVRILKSIIDKGISVLVFPEGTFNETHRPLKDFYNGAFRIAIETQTPLKPVLFLDNFDRMPYTSLFSLNPGRCRVLYLPEISVDGLSISDLETLKQKTKNMMEQKLIEYKATWIKNQLPA